MSYAGCGTRLACSGYAVIGIDYEGHGRSGGARCYIKKFDNIVNDCDSFFKFVCGWHTNYTCLFVDAFFPLVPQNYSVNLIRHFDDFVFRSRGV